MNVFDQASRFATTTEPAFVLKRVSTLAQLRVRFRIWFNTQTVPLPRGPNRIADVVALMDDLLQPEEPWLFAHEFQSSHDPRKLVSMGIESLLFREHARDPVNLDRLFRVLSVLIYLVGECPQPHLDMQTPNGYGFRLVPVLWQLAKDSAMETLQGVESGEYTWGALFWTSLMQDGGTAEVLTWWLRLLDTVVPEQHRNDVAYVALQFSELSGCRIAWKRLLEGRNVVESILYREAVQQGEDIAQVRTTREHLLSVVNFRFPEGIPEEYLELIRTQESYTMLKDWFQAALAAENAEAFLAVLRR